MTDNDELLTAEEVSALTKGAVTVDNLRMRRFKAQPPVFLKPTPRTVLYRKSDVIAWLDGSERTGTAAAVAS